MRLEALAGGWRRSCRLWPLATIAVVGLLLGGLAPSADAEACPGAGPGPCPYAGVEIIGRRAEGVLRFPEAVAVDPQGDVFVADQLSYVVQKFSSAGAFEGEWGSYGGRGRPVRADRWARHRLRRGRLRPRLEPQQDREVRPERELPHLLGPSRQRSRPVQLRLLSELHRSAGRRHRRGRELRLRRRQRQRPDRALQPRRGRTVAVGSLRPRARTALISARCRGRRR